MDELPDSQAPGIPELQAGLDELLARVSRGGQAQAESVTPLKLERAPVRWTLLDDAAGLALDMHPFADPFRVAVRALQGASGARLELGLDDSLADPATRASALDLVSAWLEGALYVEREDVGETCVGMHLCFRTKGAAGKTLVSWEGRAALGWRARLSPRSRTQLACELSVELAGAAPLKERPPWAPWAGWGGYAQALAREVVPARALQIDGELDLHNFSPKEVGRLVREYIVQARSEGVLQLRIVHGKGKGVLRRTVHAELERNDAVKHFALGGAGAGSGSWGATLVNLHPLE